MDYGWINLRKGRLLLLLRQKFFNEAEVIYQRLEEFSMNDPLALTSKVSQYHYLVSFAMAAHLDNRRGEAKDRWYQVRNKIIEWRWYEGFSEMVFCYAISEICFKQGRTAEAESLL